MSTRTSTRFAMRLRASIASAWTAFCAVPGGRLVANPGALQRDPAPGVDVQTQGTFGVLTIASGAATFEVRRAATGALVALPS